MSRVLSFLAAAVAASTTCGLVEAETLVEIVAASPELKTLLDLVQEAGIAGALNDVTVFAPTNEAFTKLAPETVAKLQSDTTLLRQVLEAHVVAGFQNSTELLKKGRVETLLSTEVIVKQREDGAVTVDESVVTKPNVMASNGIAHEIDYVIVPSPTGAAAQGLGTTVVEIASWGANPNRVLSELLILAGLTGALSGLFPQGVTLFAPSDDAFGKLPKAVVEKLLRPENRDTLTKILLFHVVPTVTSTDGTTYKTLEGSEVTRSSDAITVGGKIAATTGATDGTLHGQTGGQLGFVIQLDSVLLPPDVSLGNLTAM